MGFVMIELGRVVSALLLTVAFASGFATGVVSERGKCPTQPIIWEHTTVPQATEF